jgi:archaemetzincin
MNGSNGLGETDRAPSHLCPACLRKIHWGLKFDPSDRYRLLGNLLKEEEMGAQAAWFMERSEKTQAR